MNSPFKKLPAKYLDDRIYVCPVTLDGTQVTFYTDTCGGSILIDPDLVRRLDLPIRRPDIDDTEELRVPFPTFQTTASIPAGAEIDELLLTQELQIGEWGQSGSWGQGFLGAPWFANRIWKFDYPSSELGYLPNREPYDATGCKRIEVGFQYDDDGERTSNFPRIQASVDGQVLDFIFDTGATVHLTSTAQQSFNDGVQFKGTCFIVESIFEKWRARHPDWGIIEDADELGRQPMIEVPAVTIAGFTVGPVWFTRRRDEDFHQFMSQWTDKQISGALGGSLFRYFSIIIDYPGAVAYLKHDAV